MHVELPKLAPALSQMLCKLRHVALDMDGTIYSGGTLFPFTLPFLNILVKLGIGYTFLTNNSSKSSRDYLQHLQRLGMAVRDDQLYTSTQSTLEHLRRNLPHVRRLFVLGTSSMREEFTESGFVLTEDDPLDEPHAVVIGFDTGLEYSRLCRAAFWIKKGKTYIATHPDRVCPTDSLTVLVDCGAICAALNESSGRRPDVVLGKPDPCMLRGILERHTLQPKELAMVGDRIYTDIAMAHRAGILGVLVLTGETTVEETFHCATPPDLIVANLEELGSHLRECRCLDQHSTCRDV